MNGPDIIPHLFKTEYSKIVSVLTKSFGLEHIEIAEDIASETFLSALNNWSYKGKPENPTAWLYTVAKNKLKNHLVKNNTFNKKVSAQIRDEKQFDEIRIDFSPKNITDSQLQMLFAVCHPSISSEAQICLALRILCGLGLNEIADAFFTNKETIHKRLQRAKTSSPGPYGSSWRKRLALFKPKRPPFTCRKLSVLAGGSPHMPSQESYLN